LKKATLVLVLAALLMVLVVAMTAIDKYDERTCVQGPYVSAPRESSQSLRRGGGGIYQVAPRCPGFLPW